MRTILSLLGVAALALVCASCGPAQKPASPGAAAQSPPPAASADIASPATGSTGTASADQADGLFVRAGFAIPAAQIMSTDFTLETLDGKKTSLSSFRGKVVVLSFWATWCVPCQQEMPAMQELYDDLKGKGLEIVAVDVLEDRAKVAAYRKERGYTFPILLDTTGGVAGTYGAQSIPTNYVIDAKGRVRARVIGVGGPAWNSPEMKALFDHLLAS